MDKSYIQYDDVKKSPSSKRVPRQRIGKRTRKETKQEEQVLVDGVLLPLSIGKSSTQIKRGNYLCDINSNDKKRLVHNKSDGTLEDVREYEVEDDGWGGMIKPWEELNLTS